jgi:hypothetical protein
MRLSMRRQSRSDEAAAVRLLAVFEPEDGDWIARIAQIPECIARGGSIAQARKRLRAALADVGMPGPHDVVEDIRLPPEGCRALERLDRARRELELAERDAVEVLVRGLGLALEDASDSLGITMRRTVHLAGEASDRDLERRRASRGTAVRPASWRGDRTAD